TMSVRQLEAAGLVIRRPSLSDGRATMVELSDQGRELLPKLKAAWVGLAEETVAGLSSTSQDQVRKVLSELAASLTRKAGSLEDVPHYIARPEPR
ncbi:MAG: MarR family winged helix-turn-helix transcriptional regulator, partial [Candidatus Dormiibacterota bacterium]